MKRAIAVLAGCLACTVSPAVAEAPALPATSASTETEWVDAVPLGPSPADRLAEIRRRVQDAVVYPQRARELGLQGTAKIQFQVGSDGLAHEVTAVDSSGHAALDAAAVRSARDAGQLPPLYGWIRIPIDFQLNHAR